MTFMNLKEHASPPPRQCRSTIVVTLLLTATYISALKADARLGSGAEAPHHYGCQYPITQLNLYKPLLHHYIPKTKFPPIRYRRRRRYARITNDDENGTFYDTLYDLGDQLYDIYYNHFIFINVYIEIF